MIVKPPNFNEKQSVMTFLANVDNCGNTTVGQKRRNSII